MLAFLLRSCLALAVAVPADAAPTVTRRVLANGLEVLLQSDPRLPVIAVHVRYHVGAVDDPPQRRGLAHIVEHLMFEGSAHIDTDAREAARGRAAIHHDNAETDLHSSEYFTLAPAVSLATVLWLESDRMGFLRHHAGAATLARIKAIVAQERRQRRETDPRGARIELLFTALFPATHPYHDTVMGSHAAIEAVTLADVDTFLAAHHGPQHATLTIVGDLPPYTNVLVDRYFATLPGRPVPSTSPKLTQPVPSTRSAPSRPIPSTTPKLSTPVPSTRPNHSRPVPSTRLARPRLPLPAVPPAPPRFLRSPGPPGVLCGWLSPAVHTDGDAALDVLFAALSAGALLRLAGRDAPQIARFDAQQLSHPQQSVALAELLGRPGAAPEALHAALTRVLARVADGDLDDAEVERARLRLITRQRIATQELTTRAALVSGYAAELGDANALAFDLQQWRDVRPTDVAAAARALLTANTAVVLTGPP